MRIAVGSNVDGVTRPTLEIRIAEAHEDDPVFSEPGVARQDWWPPATGETVYVARTICGRCALILSIQLHRVQDSIYAAFGIDEETGLPARLEQDIRSSTRQSTIYCRECNMTWPVGEV